MSSDLLPRGLLANGAMGTLSEISCLFATIRHNYRHHSRQHWNNEQRRCGRLWRVLSPRYGAQGSLKGVPVGPLGHPYCPYRLPISIGWKSKSSPPVGPWVAPRFDEIKYQVLPSPLHLSPQIVVVITNGLYMLMRIMRFEIKLTFGPLRASSDDRLTSWLGFVLSLVSLSKSKVLQKRPRYPLPAWKMWRRYALRVSECMHGVDMFVGARIINIQTSKSGNNGVPSSAAKGWVHTDIFNLEEQLTIKPIPGWSL